MDLQEVGCGGTDMIALVKSRDRLQVLCECSNETSGSITCREFLN